MSRVARIDGPEAFQAAFRVSRETIDRLRLYAGLLERWQKAVNLVAPSTLGQVWHRHFADSAQLARLVPPQAKSLVDLGSGAGFPGLVMALILAETRPVKTWLIEADQRKAAFLADVKRQTGIAVDILSTRIESPETQAKVGQVDVVTARALAPLDRLLALARPYFGAHTLGLFLKGREVASELAAVLPSTLPQQLDLLPSCTLQRAKIVVVKQPTAMKGAGP